MSETFRRYEKKYLLDGRQYEELLEKMKGRIRADKFFASDINSIYYDTDKLQLIRRSVEKPEYKEKLRIRSYREAGPDDEVYVEFKKKLDGIVYKRRTKGRCAELLEDIGRCHFADEQIGKEISYALSYYPPLRPAIYIGCKRNSYVAEDDRRLRLTFDKDIRYRLKKLSLNSSEYDKPVTDRIVMELKVPEALPLWLTAILDELAIYPQGFSKVGTAFMKEIRGI